MLRPALLMILFGVECAANAAALTFGADPAAAQWDLTASADRCDLEQPIPDFGTARFSYRPQSGLAFELEPSRALFTTAAVSVSRRSPTWRSTGQSEDMTAITSGPDGLLLDGDDAERFLRALYLGDDALWEQSDRAIAVTVSTVNFRALYAPFSDCVAALRPGSFADHERTSLTFATADVGLDTAATARIAAVARYVASDRRIAKVFVDGHTDATGQLESNLLLSKRRAETVEAALIAQGTPAALVVLRYHGARYPVASNETEIGRAENRRVTIRLERDAPAVAQR